uniref:Uncharacterized protein n=1 Tax=Onchocerca volvulus TaxID=6282 RepID=A0A8R1XPQ4_ONCVO
MQTSFQNNENVKRIMQKQISDASDYAVTQFALMNSNNELLSGSSSCEQFDISQYRRFLEELQNHASELWETALCRGPASNTIELLREHAMIRESLLEIEKMQKIFLRSSEIDLTIAREVRSWFSSC